MMQKNCFPVCKLLLFVFTFTNGIGRRRKEREKKGKIMTTRCFFPFLGNVSPCKSLGGENDFLFSSHALGLNEWLGIFLKGVC